MSIPASVADVIQKHGVFGCQDPVRLQTICDGLSHHKIERLPRENRYCLTKVGFRTALFYTCSLSHVIRPFYAALDHSDGELQERILGKLKPFVADACELKTAA